MHDVSRLTVVSRKAKKVQGECDHYCEYITQANILIKWRHYFKQNLRKHSEF